MSSYDDFFRIVREADRILSPFRDLEHIYGGALQQAANEMQERERFFLAALPKVQSTYASAIASLQLTNKQQLLELDRHILPMSLLAEANSGLLGFLSKQEELKYVAQTIALNSHWQDSIKTYQQLGGGVNAAEITLMSHYTTVAESALLAQERLLGVPWESIGRATQINPIEFSGIIKGFTSLTEAYRPLMHSFEEREHFMASFPPIASGGPPLEILTSARVLDALSRSLPEEDYPEVNRQMEADFDKEIESSTDELLLELNPHLHSVWLGAKEAFRSGNPDRARHISVSLRELVTQVLHTLAPNNQVKIWTNDPSHFHDTRPTREARILFICRGINHGRFSTFVSKDVGASIEFIRLFQKGTHELEIPFSDAQLHMLITRTESLLRFLLLTNRTNQ